MPSLSIYCASKGGIKLLTKALALDLRAFYDPKGERAKV
jgi:NAD(P)-dependent dehydrogenase (short-subunit alcohol dehydrogenase family)